MYKTRPVHLCYASIVTTPVKILKRLHVKDELLGVKYGNVFNFFFKLGQLIDMAAAEMLIASRHYTDVCHLIHWDFSSQEVSRIKYKWPTQVHHWLCEPKQICSCQVSENILRKMIIRIRIHFRRRSYLIKETIEK